MPAMFKANERCYNRTFEPYGLETSNHRSELKILWDTFRSQNFGFHMIAGSQTIADDRRRSQTIAEDRTWFYRHVFVLPLLIVIFVWKKSQYLWNKHIKAWKMLCRIFIHSLFRIRKLTRSLRSLVRFLILLNSWIKIVSAHFPWSNLYFKHSKKLIVDLFCVFNCKVCMEPATRYPLPATRYQSPATRHPLLATHHPLPATCYPLSATRHPWKSAAECVLLSRTASLLNLCPCIIWCLRKSPPYMISQP